MQEAQSDGKGAALGEALDKAEREIGVRTVFPPNPGETRTPPPVPPAAPTPAAPPAGS